MLTTTQGESDFKGEYITKNYVSEKLCGITCSFSNAIVSKIDRHKSDELD